MICTKDPESGYRPNVRYDRNINNFITWVLTYTLTFTQYWSGLISPRQKRKLDFCVLIETPTGTVRSSILGPLMKLSMIGVRAFRM